MKMPHPKWRPLLVQLFAFATAIVGLVTALVRRWPEQQFNQAADPDDRMGPRRL